MTVGGLFTPMQEAFISGLTLGFMFGMIFVVICWIWLDDRTERRRKDEKPKGTLLNYEEILEYPSNVEAE